MFCCNPDIAKALLLKPKEIQQCQDAYRIAPDSLFNIGVDDPRVEQAALRWRSTFCRPRPSAPPPRGFQAAVRRDQAPTVRITVDRIRVPHPDGYRLDIRPSTIELIGGSPAGCFWGLQTLTQLSRLQDGTVPCCTVVDHPDFGTRGLLHDVTRGKVPKLETLKLLVDRLVLLKISQLQLYIEHAFTFSFDPDICGPEEGLILEEVRELDAYCRARFIDLVPALATFGHMGRVLSMPRYRHLAEVEATKSWYDMSWPERMRGLTLDCSNQEAHRLVERMWSDVLDAFSSPVVNVCGDEPWDLGRGKNRQRFARGGKAEAYVEQIRRTHEICAARGRRTQFWSDIIRKHPDLLDRLPRGSTVLHWGYDDRADYEGTATFVAAGLDTFVCPGTSGWKRILNAMNLAERNIAMFAAAGRRHGATGLLNTDWGDHGHFNLPACSWHGIALGAALAWDVEHPTGEQFDERFAQAVLGLEDSTGVRLLRRTSRIAERCETWRLLRLPLRALAADPSLPGLREAAEARQYASEFCRWSKRAVAAGGVDRHDFAELAVAARFMELFADKVALAHATRDPSRGASETVEDRHARADAVTEATAAYAGCWTARNKPAGLDDIVRALSAVAAESISLSHPYL